MRAYKLGRYQDKNVYRFPVKRWLSDGNIYKEQTRLETIYVTAHKAADAANFALAETQHNWQEPCEVIAYGPRGGECLRYAGWYSTIGNALGQTNNRQRRLA
jgi:hypothetical protein